MANRVKSLPMPTLEPAKNFVPHCRTRIEPALTAAMTGQDASRLVPYTLNALAADSAGLLDAIGVEKADVLGVSMGGLIAHDPRFHATFTGLRDWALSEGGR